MYRTTGRLTAEELMNGAGSERRGGRDLGHGHARDGGPELEGSAELHARRGPRRAGRPADRAASACGWVLVREVMSRAVPTTSRTRLDEALSEAQDAETEVLLVVDDGVLVGVLAPWETGDADASTRVELLMSGARAVNAEATIDEAASILGATAAPCLPVVARGCVVGIITRRDLRIAGVPKEALEAAVPWEELGAGD